jgi:nitroreductase
MRTWKLWIALGILVVVAGAAGTVVLSAAEDAGAPKAPEKVALVKPLEKADVDVLKAIRGRHSNREFDVKKPIPENVLATVLWAADGVNRPNGKHTAPTAMGIRHMRIYVFKADGFWRYDQDKHELLTMGKEDLRAKVARQKFMHDVPALVVMTSDLSAFETKDRKPEDARRREWSHYAAGAIGQNIYLAAEAFGLGTVVAAGVNADEVKKALELKADEVPLYVMPLGYPKAAE